MNEQLSNADFIMVLDGIIALGAAWVFTAVFLGLLLYDALCGLVLFFTRRIRAKKFLVNGFFKGFLVEFDGMYLSDSGLWVENPYDAELFNQYDTFPIDSACKLLAVFYDAGEWQLVNCAVRSDVDFKARSLVTL
ncbi:hypothetical protein HWQ46_00380 [Shewanella sp. D64]|uniref:hypothetical protein n=1 Tax=unclassified Shewanella TaxID=196818 RepID=UPI0022BA2962|nr:MULTISPECIES: hypothetical protein [unclassified Shewanella]MEC4724008.1 hypothetical protein [Shewanella sp. D64]MEC4736028.1 hypothetical protein [Shewanella sp. E94]WBJ98026.1 hypothetical protein HWQ47_13475 [Shewanella sp. MTB7]WBJ98037.1 hypothetical protein HWQ47_13530 [Shewanella sp. MTB7]